MRTPAKTDMYIYSTFLQYMVFVIQIRKTPNKMKYIKITQV